MDDFSPTGIYLLSDVWGSQYGGIGSFNVDFAKSLGQHLKGNIPVACVVIDADVQAEEEARESGVRLARIHRSKQYDSFHASRAREVAEAISKEQLPVKGACWVGHDIITGDIALAMRNLDSTCKVALIHHMSYIDYVSFKHGIGEVAKKKRDHQRCLFEQSDLVFGVGPLLRNALADLLHCAPDKVRMIVPGFPDVPTAPMPTTFIATTFGRLDPINDRIKQGRLVVAGFAEMCRRADEQAGMPTQLKRRPPRLDVVGISDPGGDEEIELSKFAEDRAGFRFTFNFLPYDTDRQAVLKELAGSSAALMLSWHEGFGLTGWEAIGANVPLIVSRNSGVYMLIDELLSGSGLGCVNAINVQARSGGYDNEGKSDDHFTDAAVNRTCDALLAIAADPESAKKNAEQLRSLLEEHGCTWEAAARAFVDSVGVRLDVSHHESVPSASESLEPGADTSIDHLFVTSLPFVGNTDYERQEKYTLFGGRPDELSLRFNAVEYAVARHSFDREIVTKLFAAVRVTTRIACRSFTLRGLPGTGLSLALAQLVRELSHYEDTRVFWVIDDANHTRNVVSQLSSTTAEDLYRRVSTDSSAPSQIVIVLDDVSEIPTAGVRKLFSFRDKMRQLATKALAPKVTFVFGSFGAARTVHEHEEFELKLEAADRMACYEHMRAEPQVILGKDSKLSELLRRHPEARWFEHDTQAFIDFVLEYGGPTREAMQYWLAKRDGLSQPEEDILTSTAVVQLLGLHIEDTVAKRLFSEILGEHLDDIEIISTQIHGIVPIEKEWRGLGLTCARRAESILNRAGRNTFEYLLEIYQKAMRASLLPMNPEGQHAAHNFARHIFQRLSKRKLWLFEHRFEIAQHLIVSERDSLEVLPEFLGVHEKARWAGTLAAVLALRKDDSIISDADYDSMVEVILELCEQTLNQIFDHDFPVSSKVVVSLHRALRLLLNEESRYQSRVRDLSEQLLYKLSIVDLVNEALVSGGEEAEFRANELIHARANLEDRLVTKREWDGKKYKQSMSTWLDKLSEVFRRSNASFDAGNWLKRAKYVWVPEIGLVHQREKAIERKASYLKQAMMCIQEDAFGQGTWDENVSLDVKRFIDENPSFASELRSLGGKGM